MEVLTKYVSFEETIKGSRFLSELFPVSTQNQARDLIKAQKSKYNDATHVVHAFIAGTKGEISGCSDDGEPGGTAGRPALDVLKGRNCTNLILTITRWFGGTKLGTGGLVKAYANGAKQVLEKATLSSAFEEYVEKEAFTFSTDYSLYKLIKNNFSSFDLWKIKEDFGTEVKISGLIKKEQKSTFSVLLKNLSNGKIKNI